MNACMSSTSNGSVESLKIKSSEWSMKTLPINAEWIRDVIEDKVFEMVEEYLAKLVEDCEQI